MKWGIQVNGHLVINARSETAAQKPLFSQMQRCIVITNGFYEWRREIDGNQKYLIQNKEPYMYLAGLCDKTNAFVIMTMPSTNKMLEYHDRMPIVYKRKEMIAYLLFHANLQSDDAFIFVKQRKGNVYEREDL